MLRTASPAPLAAALAALAALAVLGPAGSGRADSSLPPAPQVVASRGLVRLAAGMRTEPLRGAPAAAARAFALSHAGVLGLTGGAQLAEARIQPTRLGSSVRMPVQLHGLPVLGQEVVVVLDGESRVRSVASSAEPIRAVSLARNLDGHQALRRAAEGLAFVLEEGGRPTGAFREVFYVRDSVARLAYQVHPVSLNPLENWYAVVDAQTGEVRSRVNRIYFQDAGIDDGDAGTPGCGYDAGAIVPTGTAKVWQSNPGADELTPYTDVTLPNLASPADPSGYLVGTLLDVLTCCPNEGCDPSRGAKTVTGTVSYPGIPFPVPFSTDFCDFQHRASNVLGCRADYDYSAEEPLAIDPPQTEAPGIAGQRDPADDDAFSEVHGYYHANVAYDYIRLVGDPGFLLRTAPQKTLVLTNVVFPDFATGLMPGIPVTVTGLTRIDNSMFMPQETWAAIQNPSPPGSLPQVDTIALFQGPSGDWAYDGDVVYHELIHAVITSTADFGGPRLNPYGALNEGGTLHEAIADYFASAITNDPITAEWIAAQMPPAPNGDGASRDLTAPANCPEGLVGEVHHDSLLFSTATWQLRTLLQGTDQGKTFDGAVFHALTSVTSAAGFEEMANAVAAAVAMAFPAVATAQQDVLAEYTARGALGCVRVLDYRQPRPLLFLDGRGTGYAPYAPGPVQLRLAAPEGAAGLTLTARYAQANIDPLSVFVPVQPQLRALAALDRPIAFGGTYDAVQDDAAFSAALAVDAAAETVTGAVALSAPAGSSIHVALVNDGNAQWALLDLTLTVIPAAGPDAGLPPGADASGLPEPPDASGEPGPDASGPAEEEDAGAGAQADATAAPPGPDAGHASPGADAGDPGEERGCGCASASASPLSLLALGALTLLRRARRRRE